jgi:hypothetical protein
VIAGCGGQAGGQRPVDAGPQLAAPINLANCRDWRAADPAERLGTVRQIRNFAGGPVGSSELKRGFVLEDKQAFELFDSYCAKPFARGFKLYKLYTRSAAFSSR